MEMLSWRLGRLCFFCLSLSALGLNGCSGKVTQTPAPSCSLSAPNGTCPTGQTCSSGTCVADCSASCGGTCPPCSSGNGCTAGTDCVSGLCTGNVCRDDHCNNGLQDNDETGLDCGASCGGCAASTCTDNNQCSSGLCLNSIGQCADPSCSDTIKNGSESGIDCGGECLAEGKPCSNGETCQNDVDCSSGVCNVTCQPPAPHCSNNIQDQDETDVDCGGVDCAVCVDNQGCRTGADCEHGVCGVGNSCPGPGTCVCQTPSCTDGVLNGTETGTDCGGACVVQSLTCADGQPCGVDADCASGVCNGGACQAPAPHCSNGVTDAGETDLNCGGGECPACNDNQNCAVAADCANNICGVANNCPGPSLCQCQAPNCSDGIHNGNETGVDCGGSCVTSDGKTCADGAACAVAADCASGVCNVTCQSPSCVPADGVQNGNETSVDCGGGGGCPGCATGGACANGGDCASGACGVNNNCASPPCTCQDPTCSDTVRNGSETAIDCGGSCVASDGKTCADGATCGVAADCASGVCNVTCQVPSCVPADGVQNGSETGVDCGGGACPDCGTGGGCTTGADCVSGACGVNNSCASPPCTCQDPTCTDGVQNQDEKGIDCAGACLASNLTCPPGTPCVSGAECNSGFCHNTLNTCMFSSCSPADGVQNGNETGTDCGGSDCAACPNGQGCAGNADCQSGYCNGSNICQAVLCGDGALAANEECDDNNTDFPTVGDDVLNGKSCADFFFTGGSLGCATNCRYNLSLCTGGCGNGTREGSEACDGSDLNGQNCLGLGYDDTPGLACNADCGFDVSGCTNSGACPSCPTGAYCNASTDNKCKCGLYQTACGASCANLLTDPNNCGSCGHVCSGGTACSAGQCMATCPTPLIKCGSRCIDPQIDSTYCGASADCSGANNGADCVAEFAPDRICLSGACVAASNGQDFTAAGDAPTRCLGGGPVLDLNDGVPGCDPMVPNDPDCPVPPSQSCTGDLAAISFRYALCSCDAPRIQQSLFADGFNSFTGPYDPHCENGAACTVPGSDNGQCVSDANGDGHTTCADDKGAGVGANDLFTSSHLTTVWGTLWLSSGVSQAYSLPPATVEQELHIGGSLSGGPVRVRDDAYVSGNITATGSIDGTLYQSSGTTSGMTASTIDRAANPLVVPEACDCSPAKRINVPAIVNAHACLPQGSGGCSGAACCSASNNNNADITLNPTMLVLGNTDIRVDLPCGNYYFTNIVAGANATVSIVVHGRTAIYVEGDIDIPKILNITLTDSAELDIFVKGGICNNDTINVGSPSYPSRVRFYAGGGDLLSGGSGTTCAQNSARAMALKNIVGAANLYAPFGEIYMPQTFTLYGSVFAGGVEIVQPSTFHYDTGIVNAGQSCEHCGNGVINPGEQCDGNALGGTTCIDLGYSGGTLACGPNCTFDVRGCCGDGTIFGSEECDGTNLNGQTCASFGQVGTLSCSSSCTFQGCTAAGCTQDGSINAGAGEECDQGNPTSNPDIFPANRDTCAEALGVAGAVGSLVCTAGCLIDPSACTYCGDGLRNGSEVCDGVDFDPAPGVQNTPPACSVGNGVVTCAANCTLDTSGCVGCSDCRDCNNQACVGGTCGACTDSSECCAPLLCLGGTCTLF